MFLPVLNEPFLDLPWEFFLNTMNTVIDQLKTPCSSKKKRSMNIFPKMVQKLGSNRVIKWSKMQIKLRIMII